MVSAPPASLSGGEGSSTAGWVDQLVIVEGVSALHVDLAPLYDLRIWVESDAQSTLAASAQRGMGPWVREWRELFLPSVELYLLTKPRERADIVARGRGK